jgi:probable HAF family extracellular repeat protein
MNTLRQLRNLWKPWVMTIVLACFSDAVAQTSYTVLDLGPQNIGNDNLGCAMTVNNLGWTETMNGFMDPVSNFSGATVVTGHAVINIGELRIDLGTLGGPGTNTWMNFGGLNDRGEAVGFGETSVPDPDGESFCSGSGLPATGLTCRGFLWRDGHMSALPTVGGNNGQAAAINNRGQIVGVAETAVPDSGCPAGHPGHIAPPVLWENGKAQPLPTVGTDPDGFANGINDQGQAVGFSGTCTAALHGVLWENNTAFPLPDLGGGAIAYGINDHGQIVGTIGSADGTTQFAALWQNGALTNLGAVPGDFAAIATGINNRGQVVGSSMDSRFNWSHAFIWQDGVMTDLNKLFPASSNLLVTMANQINERGQISGMGTVRSGPDAGNIHAFLATPVNEPVGTSIADVAPTHPKSNLPADVSKRLLQRFRLGRFGQ